ncbi:stealth family protein [Mesorhizobium sp. CN2-181]|uniref:stealth family protein n=1 Tax=Mesorhizobium yinganensis TaxID=3157707 RepID=UPI0032B87DFD
MHSDKTHGIDAVIAWVDGSDPEHQAKLHRCLKPAAKASTTRYADRGEIYYCIASILKYASFINRIWIVTDAQRPQFLDEFARAGLCSPDFIQVVDHTELFGEHADVLPTFAARSIEAMLWRLPGLSEHFVYFNDDFFVNRMMRPDEWFVDGRPVLRGVRTRPERWLFRTHARRILGGLNVIKPRSFRQATYARAQEFGARCAGVTGRFMLAGHHPHPLRRSVQEAFYTSHPELLRKQIGYRFRDIGQFSPVSLANHLEITLHGGTFARPPREVYARPGSRNLGGRLTAGIGSESPLFGCIQSMDKFDAETLGLVRRLMRRKWGDFMPATIRLVGEEGAVA